VFALSGLSGITTMRRPPSLNTTRLRSSLMSSVARPQRNAFNTNSEGDGYRPAADAGTLKRELSPLRSILGLGLETQG